MRPAHQDRFEAAIHLELEKQQSLISDKAITSIYFGGGTPSLLEPFFFEKILDKTGHAEEITLEVNPEDVRLSKMQNYKSIGINRISLGIQSLHDPTLRIIGRTHKTEQAIEAISTVRAAGFDNITIDLMYDLPYQTPDTWEHTLTKVKPLPIQHISLYNLTFEEPSLFHRKQHKLSPHLPSPEDSLIMHQSAIATFESMGLKRYEISAFGRRSIHNTGYWTGRPFLGFGPSAFSYWEGSRFRNMTNLVKYAQALEANEPWTDFNETLNTEAHTREMLMVGLRLIEGVDLDLFQCSLKLKQTINDLIQQGYLIQDKHLKLTDKGLLFYDTVAEEIIL